MHHGSEVSQLFVVMIVFIAGWGSVFMGGNRFV